MTDKRETKLVIGLMSGTSVDGIDACITQITPDFGVKELTSLVFPYPANIKKNIFKLFENKSSIEEFCWMNFVIGEYFAEAALAVIEKAGLTPKDIDLIGSHGQTVFHFPSNQTINSLSKKSSLQIGEPSIIAERTGITTIADFRSADIAAGGQGAPLVCFADELFFKNANRYRAIQNIGGMANVTVISPDTGIFAFDIGPGNVIIDYCSKKYFNKDYDESGNLAKQGKINSEWLAEWLQDPYYKRIPPKTTGRELYNVDYIEQKLKTAPENPYDIIATVTALTARTIFEAYRDFVFPKTKIEEIVIGGGGAYNLCLLDLLQDYFGENIKIKTHEDFSISNKFKEAMAFALLAYTTFYNIPNNVPSCTGASHKTVLGKISYKSEPS